MIADITSGVSYDSIARLRSDSLNAAVVSHVRQVSSYDY